MKSLMVTLLCFAFFIGKAQPNDPFVCSFKCNSSFSNIKATCFSGTGALMGQKPVPPGNINPYEEFQLILTILRKDRGNPFPLLYSFRECKSICNAASVCIDSMQYIFYNQEFLNTIKSTNPNAKWAVRAIIAHEIGHHILEHTLVTGANVYPQEKRKLELRADYFSAFVIKQFPGGTLDNALAGIGTFDKNTYIPANAADENVSDYPTLENRAIAVNQGFSDNDQAPLKIAMFRNIDSIGELSIKNWGRSIIMHEINQDIAFSNYKGAKEKIDQLLNESVNQQDKLPLIKIQTLLNDEIKKIDNHSIQLTNPTPVIKPADIDVLKSLYEQYKRGKTDLDKIKTESLKKTIDVLEFKGG